MRPALLGTKGPLEHPRCLEFSRVCSVFCVSHPASRQTPGPHEGQDGSARIVPAILSWSFGTGTRVEALFPARPTPSAETATRAYSPLSIFAALCSTESLLSRVDHCRFFLSPCRLPGVPSLSLSLSVCHCVAVPA